MIAIIDHRPIGAENYISITVSGLDTCLRRYDKLQKLLVPRNQFFSRAAIFLLHEYSLQSHHSIRGTRGLLSFLLFFFAFCLFTFALLCLFTFALLCLFTLPYAAFSLLPYAAFSLLPALLFKSSNAIFELNQKLHT